MNKLRSTDIDWNLIAKELDYPTPYLLLYDLYWTQSLTTYEMDKKLGVAQTAILRKMDREGVPRRKRGWNQRSIDRYWKRKEEQQTKKILMNV